MQINSPDISKRKARDPARVNELLSDRNGMLPVWIRAPKAGPEYFSGFSRSKLYQLDALGKIDSRSIRQPGQVRGTRLFNLRSILDFIESCGAECKRPK
jgi:hypothetical protein